MCVQSDRYTIGGSEMFDTLTDLVEHYKRKGIEEISGNWVHLKQVNRAMSHKMTSDIWSKSHINPHLNFITRGQELVFVKSLERWAAQPTDRKHYSLVCVCLNNDVVQHTGSSFPLISIIKCSFPLAAVLLHQGECSRHRQQGEAVGPDHAAAAGGRGREEQGGLLGGIWRKTWAKLLVFFLVSHQEIQ